MKTTSLSLRPSLRVVCGFALAALFTALLAPPSFGGPPVKTPDTSAPAEARTPIGLTTTPGDADSLYRITQPGSYYLTGNVTGVSGKMGIKIASSRVTIDLNGFTMQGVAGSLNGIELMEMVELTVRNGVIRGWNHGILAGYEDGHFVDLTFSDNLGVGLWVGSAIVTDCIASGNGWLGIRATTGSVLTRVIARSNGEGISTIGDGVRLVDCSARDNTAGGIKLSGEANALVGCSATDNGAEGFQSGGYTTFERCTAKNNGGNGFTAASGSTLSGCTSFFNDINGFNLSAGAVIVESTANANTNDGIHTASNCRVENCSSTDNGRMGFFVGFGSQIRGCVARQNFTAGITVDADCHVESNLAVNNGIQAPAGVIGAGIKLLGSGCRVDGNTCTGNKTGILAETANTIVIRNCARGNTGGNYIFGAGMEYAQIIVNPGAAFVSTNPWANFAY